MNDIKSSDLAFVASGDPRLDTFNKVASGGTGPIWRLARELDRRNHSVTIYSSTYDERTQWAKDGVTIVEIPTVEAANSIDWVIDQVPFSQQITRIDQLSTTPGEMVERLFTRLLFSRRVANQISEDNPDIVYLRDRLSALFAARNRTASVFTVTSPDACDFYYESAVTRHPINRGLFRYKQFIEESVLNNADEIIVMNKTIANYINEKGFQSVNTVTVGISEKNFSNVSSRQEKPYILYAGRLDGNKRPEWVLDAFLKSESNKFELHFIGSGPRQEFLHQRVADSSRKEDVTLHSQIPRTKVLQWMREAAVFVLPSKFEVCPNVIIEAMASGCPVVTSNTMGAKELIIDGKTGILFDKDDKPQLRERLDYVLSNKNKRQELARAAYEYALQNYTSNTIADKYLEIGNRAKK